MAHYKHPDAQKPPRMDEALHTFLLEADDGYRFAVQVRGTSQYTARQRLLRRLQSLLGDPKGRKR